MVWKKRLRRTHLAQVGWSGGQVLAAIQALNKSCVAQLAQAASAPHAADAWATGFGFRDLWTHLGDEACGRAGSCPVLLLTMNFEHVEWWQRVAKGQSVVRADATAELFTTSQATSLVREILTEARSVARAQPSTGRLVFGMSSHVWNAVAELTAGEIDRIAVDHGRELRPRWEDCPSFWKRLLEAAIGTDARVFAKVHLHCIQLLGRDL